MSMCVCAVHAASPLRGFPGFKESGRNAPCVSFNPAALRFSILVRLHKDIGAAASLSQPLHLVCVCVRVHLYSQAVESDSLRIGYVILKGEQVDFTV